MSTKTPERAETHAAGPAPRKTPRWGPRPAPAPGAPSVISTAITMVAIVCLWTVAQLLVFSGISHDRSQTLLYQDFRRQLSDLTAPIGPVVPVGDPVALLSIPRIGLSEVVVEGTASGDTLAGPGHLRNSVLPGQAGQSLVYGRHSTYGAPFRHLADLQTGDVVHITTAQGEKDLRITGIRREGDPKPAAPADGQTRLTMVTAEGDGRFSALTPDRTVFVDAEAEDAWAAPPNRPPTVPEAEMAMAKDSRALPLLALCLALLLALTVAVVAARQRWSATLVWVVASPVALMLAWLTTDTVMRLLPNLI